MKSIFHTEAHWRVGNRRIYLAKLGREYVPCLETGSQPVIVGRGDPYPTLEAGIKYCDHVVKKLAKEVDKSK
jgi:hypothetical protein